MEIALDISGWHRPEPLFIRTGISHSTDENPGNYFDSDIPSDGDEEIPDSQELVHGPPQSATASALPAINAQEERQNIPTSLTITEMYREKYLLMLDQRLIYLNDLSSLRPGWIHGSGDVPSAQVLDVSKQFVILLREHIRYSPLSKIPRLVMGPLPYGGLGFELHTQDDSTLFVTVKNNSSVEIERKIRGRHESTPINSDYLHFANQALSLYDAITES